MDRKRKYGFANKYSGSLRHKMKGKKHSRDKDREGSRRSKRAKSHSRRVSHSHGSPSRSEGGSSVEERTVFEAVGRPGQPARCKKHHKSKLKWKASSDGSESEKKSAEKTPTTPSPSVYKIRKRSSIADSSSEGSTDHGAKADESKKVEEREKERDTGGTEPTEEGKIDEDRSKTLYKDRCKNVDEDKYADERNVDKEKYKYVDDDKYKDAEEDKYKDENDNEEEEKDKGKKEDEEEENEKKDEKEEDEKEDKESVKTEEKDNDKENEKNTYSESEKEKDSKDKGKKKEKDKQEEEDKENSNWKVPSAQLVTAPTALRPRYKRSECVWKHSVIVENYKHLLQEARPIEKLKKETVPTFRLRPTSEVEPRNQDDGSTKANAAGEEKGTNVDEKATENGESGGGIMHSSKCGDFEKRTKESVPTFRLKPTSEVEPRNQDDGSTKANAAGEEKGTNVDEKATENGASGGGIIHSSKCVDSNKHRLKDARPIEKQKKEPVPTFRLKPTSEVEPRKKDDESTKANAAGEKKGTKVIEKTTENGPSGGGIMHGSKCVDSDLKDPCAHMLSASQSDPSALRPRFKRSDYAGKQTAIFKKCKHQLQDARPIEKPNKEPEPTSKLRPPSYVEPKAVSVVSHAETESVLEDKTQEESSFQREAQPESKTELKGHSDSRSKPQAQPQMKPERKGELKTKARPQAHSQPKFDFKGHLVSWPQPQSQSEPRP